jgi:hypothetical protein
MKTSIAALLAVLALLFADLAGAQTPVTHQAQVQPKVTQGGAGRPGAMRGTMAAPFPVAHRPPSFARHPFHRHPSFFGSGFYGSGFYGSGLYAGSPAYAPAQGYAYGYDYPAYGYDYPGYAQSATYAPPQAQYWAYCRNPQGYYPYVSECSEGWLPVTPTSSPPPLIPAQTPDVVLQPKAASGGGDSIEEIRARIARSRAD